MVDEISLQNAYGLFEVLHILINANHLFVYLGGLVNLVNNELLVNIRRNMK